VLSVHALPRTQISDQFFAIGAGLLPEPVVRDIVGAVKSANAGLFNINFLTNFDHEAQARACAEMGAPIISFHWGHPKPALIKALRDALDDDVLLLAFGSIADGRGVAAALQLGADGVWVGTRLVATDEALDHPEHKRRVVAATGTDTVYLHIFGPDNPDFNPMRLLKNKVVNAWNNRLSEVPKDNSQSPIIGKTLMGGQPMELRKFNVLLPTPDTEGDWEEMPFLARQGVGLVNDILPAEQVVNRMMDKVVALLKKGVNVRA
jgi:NAD(P)H-dependent flavin oxidoreductase YrpB (nitropropane dioxygenase family)